MAKHINKQTFLNEYEASKALRMDVQSFHKERLRGNLVFYPYTFRSAVLHFNKDELLANAKRLGIEPNLLGDYDIPITTPRKKYFKK